MTAKRSNRGGMMLGLAGLILMLAVLCASVLARSLESYRSSAFHVQRLQATAAAEGAAVAWQRDPRAAGEPLEIGDVIVTPMSSAPAEPDTTASLELRCKAEVMNGARVAYTAAWAARYAPAGAGWQLIRLEPRP